MILSNEVVFILLCAIIPAFCEDEKYTYTVKYIEVPVDHFDYNRNDTFKLRYLVNTTFWDSERGPILFYTGNEGDIELFAQNTGFVWELAPSVRGLIIFAEHRYYGQSLPFGNKSFIDSSHLGYLSSSQALADYADLLTLINKPHKVENGKQSNPVVAFGGSYGGMLAAWIRMKYPHLVTGAIASSAPVLQFTDVTPCGVFSRIVTSDFQTMKKNCSDNIRRSWKEMRNMAASPEGLAWLSTTWGLCPPLKKIQDLEDYLTEVYGNLAMANYPYPANFLAPMPGNPVTEVCARLNDTLSGKNLIIGIQKALTIYTNYTGSVKCLNITNGAAPDLGEKGWDFQACTEMVMPMCSDGVDDMFPKTSWDEKVYSDDCFKKYGVRPRFNAATTLYGGRQLSGASNIVFSNGLLDPWSGGGVLNSYSDSVIAVIIPEGAHHLDLRASNPSDPQSVVQARIYHTQAIEQWVKDYWGTSKTYRKRRM